MKLCPSVVYEWKGGWNEKEFAGGFSFSRIDKFILWRAGAR
jgi:hypothetical protein